MRAKKTTKAKPKKAVRKPSAARTRPSASRPRAKAPAKARAKAKVKGKAKGRAKVKTTAAKSAVKTRAKAKAIPKAKPAVKPATQPATRRSTRTSTRSRTAKPAAPAKSRPSPTLAAKPKVPRLADEPLPKSLAATADSDAEEADGYDMSLLSGPRDVKPYIPRRGEQYMNQEQLDHFRFILNSWKRDLMEEVDRTVLHMKDEAANFPDPNDRATQESEFSLELRTRDRERKLIRKIDEALARIDDSTYGYCLETGEEIGIKRLEARPVATLSLEAQERRERRERQYGDRDDRYR